VVGEGEAGEREVARGRDEATIILGGLGVATSHRMYHAIVARTF